MGFPFIDTGDSIKRAQCIDHVIGDFRCKHNGRVVSVDFILYLIDL